MVIKKGKTIYIASLDGDFKGEPFGQASKLICLAKNIEKKNAICMNCQQKAPAGVYPNVPAPYTCRLVGGNEQKVIGGADKYIAVCLKCHPILSN